MFGSVSRSEYDRLVRRVGQLEGAVEALGQRLGISPAELGELRQPISGNVKRMVSQGRRIEAIKVLRQETGMGLKEAKDAVERL